MIVWTKEQKQNTKGAADKAMFICLYVHVYPGC